MSKLKVLLLAANPSTTAPLRLAAEAREIQERVDLATARRQQGQGPSQNATQLQLIHRAALRLVDLMREIQLENPAILHFSGHGASDGSLYLEDSAGQPMELRPEDLCELLHEFAGTVRCVFMNACFTQELAENACRAVDCFIGMSGPMDDAAALSFSSAFYQNLALGSSVGRAFNLARLELGALQPLAREVPQLLCREGVSATQLMLTAADANSNSNSNSNSGPTAEVSAKQAPAAPDWLTALDATVQQGKPTTSGMRRAINQALQSDGLLKAFLLAHYPKLLRLMGDDMNRTAKLNLVLTYLRPEQYAALRQNLLDFWTANQDEI